MKTALIVAQCPAERGSGVPGTRRMELEVQESLSAWGQGSGAGICSWRTTGAQINSSEGNFGPDSIIPIPNKS